MTPQERELRRALDARSAAPSPEFRARLASALETGKPIPTVAPGFAIGVAAVLTVVAIGVLLFAGPLVHPRSSGPPPTRPGPVPGVLVAPPSPIVLPDSAQLSVPSSNVVWVLVHDRYLYRSTDRGGTWVQRPLPPAQGAQLPGISFINGSEGWFSSGGNANDCTANHGGVWHTTDAGTTWAFLGSTGIVGAGCIQGLSFVDSLHGFLDSEYFSSAPVIYRTSDGGMTWSASQRLTDPPRFTTQPGGQTLQVGLVKAFGSTLLVPAYDFTSKAGVQAVYRSIDGGATWTYLATAQLASDDIAFVSASRWLQLIEPDQSVETTDAGRTWHHYASDYSQAAPVAPQVVFGDSMVGYATVRGEIELTVDGGLHWSEIKTPGT